MASGLELVGVLVIVLVNTALTALLTRFFRVRLRTRWGSVLYTAFLVPVVLFASILVFGSLGVGADLGNGGAVIGLLLVGPLSLGVAFDYFWMPAPDEVELPETTEERRPGRSRR